MTAVSASSHPYEGLRSFCRILSILGCLQGDLCRLLGVLPGFLSFGKRLLCEPLQVSGGSWLNCRPCPFLGGSVSACHDTLRVAGQ